MHKVLITFQYSQEWALSGREGPDLEKWNDAFSIMEKEVPVLKAALEERFRRLLSGTVPHFGNGQSPTISK
jgi:hypothetical protein